MRRFVPLLSLILLGLLLTPALARAHCQVPCGIYDDQARIDRLLEDTETARKAMRQMAELAGQGDAQSVNQLVRWIQTKEEHASHVIEVVSEYFLTQKVKPVDPGSDGYDAYLVKLADHHRVMAAAMKVKQNADPAFAQKLHDAIHQMAEHYAE